MNLTLHQLRKEARYILPRWLPWLAILGLGLMVNLEWIAPLSSSGPNQPWSQFLPLAIVLGAVILTCTSAPEDLPGSDIAFGATRPLPRRDYWQARWLAWLLFILLPLTLHEAAYLTFSHRPFAEIWRGSLERAFTVVATLGMLIPFFAFWKGRHFVLASGVVLASYLISGKVIYFLTLRWLSVIPQYYIHFESQLWVGCLMVGLISLLLAFHLRNPWSLRKRLIMTAILPIVMQLLWMLSPLPQRSDRAEDQARVDALSKQAKIEMPMYEIAFSAPSSDDQNFYPEGGRAKFENIPDTTSIRLYPQSTRATQGTKELATHITHHERRRQASKGEIMFYPQYVASFPKGTLLLYAGQNSFTRTQSNLGSISASASDPEQPLRQSTDFELAWSDIQSAVDLPLSPGASCALPDATWKVISVHPNQDNKGRPLRGAVTARIQMEHSTLLSGFMPTPWDWRSRYTLALYAPERQLAWIESHAKKVIARGEHTAWQREIHTLTWRNVLTYTDDKDSGVKSENLRFKILQKRYLGSSTWTWNSPAYRPADHLNDFYNNYLNFGGSLFNEDLLGAFKRRLSALAIPTATTTKPVVRQYIYDVHAAGLRLGYEPSPEAFALWKDALRPVAQQHLDVMLALPQGVFANENPIPELVQESVTDTHRDLLIAQLPKQPWLAKVVLQRGWQAEAQKAAPLLTRQGGNLSAEVIPLMLKWGDPVSIRRLLDDLLRTPRLSLFQALEQQPNLQADLNQITKDLTKRFPPYLDSMDEEALKILVSQGSREALDLAFHLCAESGRKSTAHAIRLAIYMLPIIGEPPLKKFEDPDRVLRAFRGKKAADFEYDPVQHTWHKRPL